MYGRINRDNIHPRVDAAKLARDAVLSDLSQAADGHPQVFCAGINHPAAAREGLFTLCGQVRTGDAEGAEKGFLKLLGVAR